MKPFNIIEKYLRRHFGFSRSASNGVLMLTGIMLIAFSTPLWSGYLFKNKYAGIHKSDKEKLDSLAQTIEVSTSSKSTDTLNDWKAFNPNEVGYDQLVAAGFSSELANRVINYRNKVSAFHKKSDLLKVYDLPETFYQKIKDSLIIRRKPRKDVSEGAGQPSGVEYFSFNPNTIDASELEKLGVVEKTANTWVNYLESGGRFVIPSDIKDIYGVDEQLFNRLKPYINIPSKTKKHKINPKEISKLNINEADTNRLKKINGIGSVFAKRIVDYRNILGGFYSTDQLLEVYHLKGKSLNNLKNAAYVGQDFTVKQIDINNIAFKALLRHPYFNYDNVKSIFNYRQDHGDISDFHSFKTILSLPDSMEEKINPYLKFD